MSAINFGECPHSDALAELSAEWSQTVELNARLRAAISSVRALADRWDGFTCCWPDARAELLAALDSSETPPAAQRSAEGAHINEGDQQ